MLKREGEEEVPGENLQRLALQTYVTYRESPETRSELRGDK